MKSLRFWKRHALVAHCALVFCMTTTIAPFQNRSSFVEAAVPTNTIQDQVSGPAVGQLMTLDTWRTRDGRSLAQVIKGHSLAMTVFVDPNCEACTLTKDNLGQLRERMEKAGIAYYVLMIPAEDQTRTYFAYSDSLKLGAESFVWSSADAKPPASFTMMTLPSHLLVTNEGPIVDKWAGTPQSASTGEKRFEQIATAAVRHLRRINGN